LAEVYGNLVIVVILVMEGVVRPAIVSMKVWVDHDVFKKGSYRRFVALQFGHF
jgi:Flp pilus assembly protein protease CpaA